MSENKKSIKTAAKLNADKAVSNKPRTFRMYIQAIRSSPSRGGLPQLCMNKIDVRKRFGQKRLDYLKACARCKTLTKFALGNTTDSDMLMNILWSFPHAIEKVKKEHITQEIANMVIEKNHNMFKHVPLTKRTDEMRHYCLSKNGLILESILKTEQTPELIKIAINNDPHSIEFVKDDMMTFNTCLMAIRKDATVIKHIKNHANQKDLEMIAIGLNGLSLGCIDKDNITIDLIKSALKNNGDAIKDVPEHMITDAFRLMAVNQKGTSIQFISPVKFTYELSLAAVQQNGEAIEYLHNTYPYGSSLENEWDSDDTAPVDRLYRIALLTYPPTIAYIKSAQSPELCEKALEFALNMNPPTIKHFLKFDYKTTRMYEMALEKGFKQGSGNNCTGIIPNNMKSYKVCGYIYRNIVDNAVYHPKMMSLCPKQNSPDCLYKEQQGQIFYKAAINRNGLCIRYIDKPSEKECITAVKQNGLALFFIDTQSRDICIEAIKQNPKALLFVKRQTEEFCKLALKKDPNMDVYIDREFEHLIPPIMRGID
jgi:hypothetical protein